MRKLLNKRIPLGLSIVIIFVALHTTFLVTYFLCQKQFNSMLIQLNEKQNMFEKISILDEKVRSNFYKEIDEKLILDSTANGYIAALDDKNTSYLTQGEYMQEKLDQLKYTSDAESYVYSEYTTDDVLYVKISAFTKNTKEKLEEITGTNINADTKALVFDLRNSANDNIESVADCLSLFINGDKPIIYEKDRYSNKTTLFKAENGRLSVPCAIIINQNTANSAEIFASALKDNINAKLVGEKTAGKTTKTQIFTLNDGSAVKISTAEYLTTSETSLANIGLLPDIQVNSNSNIDENSQINLDEAFKLACDALLQN